MCTANSIDSFVLCLLLSIIEVRILLVEYSLQEMQRALEHAQNAACVYETMDGQNIQTQRGGKSCPGFEYFVHLL